MRDDVRDQLLRELEHLRCRIKDKNVIVPEEKYLGGKGEILDTIKIMRELIIHEAEGTMPEVENNLYQMSVGDVKAICTIYRIENVDFPYCNENCPLYMKNGCSCPFDYDPNNWVLGRSHRLDEFVKKNEEEK